MTNYKKLIADLREFSYVLTNSQKAADALEQLVKERDVLLWMLKRCLVISPEACGWCAHNKAEHDSTEYKENCEECAEAQHYCCWEYGGIPHDVARMHELEQKILKDLNKNE